MYAIQNTLVSSQVFAKKFVCNLSACKGACCVKGDSGAPLSFEETLLLEEIYPLIKSELRAEGIKAIETTGTSVKDYTGEHTTPLVDGKECAYVVFSENGVATCGIEKAHEKGLTTFKKPLSCHLYPIRIKHFDSWEAVNVDEWEVCKPALIHGEKSGVHLFKFLKESLIRKFGENWYKELEAIHNQLENEPRRTA